MKHRRPLKLLFYVSLLIVVLLVGYKGYLNLLLPERQALHAEQVERIQRRLADRSGIRFAVVGNINNSIGIFEQRIVPLLNRAGIDFLVSAGNAVSGGGEDKYKALAGSLGHLAVPYLLTFGENEYEDFGSFRFYEHFGPHFYSVRAGPGRLIFLDSTGKTPWQWQLRWLQDLLDGDDSRARFLFLGHPPFSPDRDPLFDQDSDYLQPPAFRAALLALIERYRIDMVFSANLALYDEHRQGPTRFITTGGAGGLVLNNDTSFYHYVLVEVSPDGVIRHHVQPLETGQHPVWKRLESLWFFIYSLFYVGYLNFFLLVGFFVLITTRLYALVFVEKDYYPDYDLDPGPWLSRPLKVAMFTNNYLPFIGGVPVSIARLRRGLIALGDRVLVVAPRYREPCEEEDLVRVPTLVTMGQQGEFRLANLLARRIRRALNAFAPDIVHLHHPFWLGSLGLFLARRRRIPVVYTYHTRLEHYAHFVPLPGVLFRNLISHALIRRFANRCDGVVVPTYSTEEYLRMIGVKSPIFVQPTGIDYPRFQQVDAPALARLRTALGLGEETVLISVSRLSSEKNIDFMLEALAALRRRSPRPFRLLLIGDGHERQRLQAKIARLELAERVTLVGAVPPEEMASWYQLGQLFLFASKSETQGMVILEAMAAGLPVVAVRSSGIEDVVKEGVNGFKTPEQQELWCARVALLLEDEALRRRLSAQARAFARQHSIECFARAMREIYATTLARAAKERGGS